MIELYLEVVSHLLWVFKTKKKCELSEDGYEKRCNSCSEMKNICEFRNRKNIKNQKNNKSNWLNSVCRQCENKDVDHYRTMTPLGIASEIVRRKKSVCLKNNLKFDLTKDFVLDRLNKIGWKCELTNLPMRSIKTSIDEKYQGFHLDSISMDRIDHASGYTKDNIRFVLNQVNVFRSNGSDERMYKIAEALLKNRKTT